MDFKLVDPCKYSFDDLIRASKDTISTKELYSKSQYEKNDYVKKMCEKAGWFWKDIVSNGIVYTAFSPFCVYCI